MSKCLSCPHAGKRAFCNLNPDARSFLEANSIVVEYPRGNVLFREGDNCSAVFIMCSGKIKISATSREGRTLILRIARAGDVVGMNAALTGDLHEVTAEALESCRVRVLPLRQFTYMLQQFGEVGIGAARALAGDYRAAFDEARLIALPGSAAGRLARLLLDWVDHASRNGSGSLVRLSLTHEELASMTATTRETVTRTLGQFRREKIISTRGIALTVLQPAALEQLAAC